MQLTGGYPFWLINDGLLYSYPKLLKNTEVNTVVIGGGISYYTYAAVSEQSEEENELWKNSAEGIIIYYEQPYYFIS